MGSSKLYIDQEKMQSVKDWPAPTCIKELLEFLGFTSYHNRFVRSFAHVALLISKLYSNNDHGLAEQ